MGNGFKSGDTVTMLADFDRRSISFSINGKDQGVAFSSIAVGPTYYFAVCFSAHYQDTYVRDKVTLMESSRRSYDADDDDADDADDEKKAIEVSDEAPTNNCWQKPAMK